jgi:predicted aldo/keto reductase-like oxidoreductase
MDYRRLGRTELRVSAVGFGTCQLRLLPERQALHTLLRGFELGVNLVHTAPDYEGAEDLVAQAIRQSGREVIVCTQAYDVQGNARGRVEHFARLFEEACARFDRDRLDLFGIACIDDRERLEENVWGPGGMVEFLQHKKAENRIGAIFCSTHGSPEYVMRLLEINVFDALMVAYNPLGFHLLSAPPTKHQPFEDLRRTRTEVFPLAYKKDVGLMIMKPLAGGLLCDSEVFAPHARVATKIETPRAGDVLRAILSDPHVACVVPGTASVEEAEENARAGEETSTDQGNGGSWIADCVAELSTTMCSRCGLCDNLCSQGLPVSWLFRAGDIALQRSVSFEITDEFEFFHLHPDTQPTCARCPNVTCNCPFGIDIPGNLNALHARMIDLRERRLIPLSERELIVGDEDFGTRVLLRDLPSSLTPSEITVCRLWVENTGMHGWFLGTRNAVHLRAFADRRVIAKVHQRHDVQPGGRTHFVFELSAPKIASSFRLRLELVEERLRVRRRRLLLHESTVEVKGCNGNTVRR